MLNNKMTTKNTFQEQLVDYLSGTTGGYIGATGSALQSTTSRAFVIGYQGPAQPPSTNSGTSCGIEFKAEPVSNASWIDFHSTTGYFNNSYDFRMQSTGGATAINGQASMICIGAEMDVRCPMRIGPQPGAPQFKLDYGQVAVVAGTNPFGTITFNFTFVSAPRVFLQVQAPATAGGDQYAFVENEGLTGSQCIYQYYGIAPANTFINWMALGV